eukprot:m.118390 g.118390  ORF g.118390 m.118390 type:complete len:131 (+) comp12892_c2_seq6:1449-1841(+)
MLLVFMFVSAMNAAFALQCVCVCVFILFSFQMIYCLLLLFVYLLGGLIVSVPDFVKIVEKYMGREATVNRVTAKDIELPVTFANVSKSRDTLGYMASTNLEDGTRTLCAFVKWLNNFNKSIPSSDTYAQP